MREDRCRQRGHLGLGLETAIISNSAQRYEFCRRKCGCRFSLSICTVLSNSHTSLRPVSTADYHPIFMAIICTETTVLRYSASTVLPDHKHEAVNIECLDWNPSNIMILPCVVPDRVKYQHVMYLTSANLILLPNLSGWMSHRLKPGDTRWTTRDGIMEW